MNQLIPLINKIQEISANVSLPNVIELPQLVVVGAQSSGKSSVLESIVGRDFLPRGSGICTRRPLILQLHNISEEKKYENPDQNDVQPRPKPKKDWAEFSHLPGEVFTDFLEVRSVIEEETNKVAGINKGISNDPILLRIYSSEVVDLTLVDLPGITKVPVGDQPQNIEDRVRDLILEYITNPNSIILAVSAGNTDLANSDALKLARVVDPKGERTLGVVTKLDLMDEGTDAIQMLQGKIYPLKLGYVGCVCRSQKDIMSHKPIEDALKSEANFFLKHPKYVAFRNKMGVPFLASKMNKTLIQHIKNSLPHLRSNVSAMLTQKEKEFAAFGIDFDIQNDRELGALTLNLISKFTTYFQNMIEGKFVKQSATQFLGGSRINYIFNEIFSRTLQDMDPFDSLRDDDIRTAIKNANGLHPNLFVPEGAFEVLVKQQIARLLEPSLQCVDMVYEELRRLVTLSDIPELSRFSPLRDRVILVMEEVLKKCLAPTNQMIRNLIEIEDAYINTSHPDFMGGANAMMSIFSEEAKQQRKEDDIFKPQQPIFSLFQENRNERQPANNNQEVGKDFGFHNLHEDAQQRQGEDKAQAKPDNGSWFPFFGKKKNPKSAEEEKQAKPQEIEDGGEEASLPSTTRNYYAGIEKHRPYDQYYLARDYDMNQLPIILPKMPSSMRAITDPSMRERMETNIIKNLITSYFDVVRKNISDSVPKTIMAFLVNQSKNVAQRELVSELYREEGSSMRDLLQEDPALQLEREECKTVIKMLKKAMEVIIELRDYSVGDVKLREQGKWESLKR